MMGDIVAQFDTPEARWAGVGPYYAMFPARFADSVVERFTEDGDTIIDPFAGRGTSLFSAATKGRHALGVEINPVGWVYAATKLCPARRTSIEARAEELGEMAGRFGKSATRMPRFYRHCFSESVLAFLLAARKHLDWRASRVDRTLMAIILIDLHGKRELAFSNQMRQTKCMSPEYALRWWKEHGMSPPKREPVAFVKKKIAWRYARGTPSTLESRVYLADCTHRLPGLHTVSSRLAPKGARLLLTSPPYFGVTNYHYDQWLRLWMLGGPELPRSSGERHRGRFQHPEHYRELLVSAFMEAKPLLAKDAVVYVRTDRRRMTSAITREVLKEVFPKHDLRRRPRPLNGLTQTRLFGNGAPDDGEVDLVLTPN
ncbi:MAG: site-specific DNA-methyltransferase [Phycisphaerales bacterium]|nr:site-specific DNA-methyltransferase [Phycisphaerales bacterium]